MPKKKLLETIKREMLIERGDKVLVAFSGGPDSSCLLHMLSSLKDDLEIKLYTAHLNHRIRGVDAHKDALFAYSESKMLGIPCFLYSVDVPSLAQEKKLSVEEAAREVRYQMLFELKDKLEIDKIATGHNLDDQAETVLMRILRGTGLNGLRGMAYKRPDGIIRPLMDIKRYEIEEYCENNQVKFVTDKTNAQDQYTRNKIRLNLLPLIEEDYSSNIKEILSRMASSLREDSDYIDSIAKEMYTCSGQNEEDYAIRFDLDTMDQMPLSILKRVIRYSYMELTGSGEGLESVHLDDAVKIIKNPKAEAMANLPKGIIAEKKGYNFYITKKPLEKETIYFEYPIKLNGVTLIPELGIKIEARTMSKDRCKLLPSGSHTKAFDMGKIQGDLLVRTRKAGDKIKPLGLGGTKKLKDIFIDKKVPRDSREKIPVIADSSKIIWVVGYDISDESKITDTTQEVIRLSIKPL